MGFFDMLGADPEIYGRKPKPVPVPTADEILREASLANLANAGNINKLAATQNEFNLDEALKEFEKVAPGVFGKLVENISAGSRGELSSGATDEIWRNAAARGIDSGTSGSLFNTNLGLRDIGRTAEAEQQRAQNNFGALMKGALPNLFDSSKMFQTPQYLPYAKFENDLYNAKIKAAPDPAKAGQAAAHVAFMESLGSSYAGTPHSGGASYSNSWDQGSGNGWGASEGGSYIGSSSPSEPWSGSYGETAGFGAFDF